ncbi:MAG: radical SAM protein [Deltaproteobacteria bacterium]|nr:radical SAM protein [Deltaproteobacteria bacterium]
MASLTPFIIPIFTPHLGCPHRCVFCNQHAITGTRLEIHRIPGIIETALSSPKRKNRPVEIAFYGGNFASLPDDVQADLLSPCMKYIESKVVRTIRISSRPDSFDRRVVQRLKDLGVGAIEIGAQSLDDSVLKLSKRGHTSRQIQEAAGLLHSAGLHVGIQIMLGLPGDTRQKALDTAQKVVELGPQIARIYPTVVLRDSELAHQYLMGRYHPLSLEEAVGLCSEILNILERGGVRVIRMGLQDSESLTGSNGLFAGPHHPAFGQLVRAASWLHRAQSAIQACSCPGDGGCFRVHPSQVSNLKGQRSSNLRALEKNWGLRKLSVVGDPSLDITECCFEPD